MTETDAQTMFIARKAQIDAMLKTLTDKSADFFDVGPDDVNWGHCGDLKYVADQLIEICDFLGVEHAL